MIFKYISKIKNYLLLFLLLSSSLFAISPIDISQDKKPSLLEQSDVYFDRTGSLVLHKVIKQNLLKPYLKKQVNTGVSKTKTWIKFEVHNSSSKRIKKLLYANSSLLEEIELFDEENLSMPLLGGVKNLTKAHTTLYSIFPISLHAGEKKVYYLSVYSHWTPIDFSLYLEEEKSFYSSDKNQQFIKIMLFSMIIILTIYSFIVAIYSRDKSYIYYSFYLLTLIYQQESYLGLNQLFLPVDFVVNIDMKMSLNKVAMMIISASLFAIAFLKTETIPWIHKGYKIIIGLAVVEIVIFNLIEPYMFSVVIATSSFLIVFNMLASIISYKKGNLEARLFIVGFSIVFFSYLMMILTALGYTSIIQEYQNTLLWGTTLEALILSLAFVDRYSLLQKEKERVDANILEEVRSREAIIKEEVIQKTALLKQAVKAKELLLKEVHHRIKNNLQIILSMVRLQRDKIEEAYIIDKFIRLENRINAIAKTYNLLLLDKNLDAIDMEEYIEALLLDLQESICDVECQVAIETEIEVTLPLRESVYIGIIINELVTNSYKYAFTEEEGKVFISMKQESKKFTLVVRDNGKGFTYNKKSKSLGLQLIYSLVEQQLQGTIELVSKNFTQYTIRFSL